MGRVRGGDTENGSIAEPSEDVSRAVTVRHPFNIGLGHNKKQLHISTPISMLEKVYSSSLLTAAPSYASSQWVSSAEVRVVSKSRGPQDTGFHLSISRQRPLRALSSHSLRTICETIFNASLVAYFTSLECFVIGTHFKMDSFDTSHLDGWNNALTFAELALEESQRAEALRKAELICGRL
ncbi:hypothetical protein EI94DRAFT_1726844 [Lactarius quietus]|nr:hypothetical protein EI94DRAFT_1726844 [Lactarius quietus]